MANPKAVRDALINILSKGKKETPVARSSRDLDTFPDEGQYYGSRPDEISPSELARGGYPETPISPSEQAVARPRPPSPASVAAAGQPTYHRSTQQGRLGIREEDRISKAGGRSEAEAQARIDAFEPDQRDNDIFAPEIAKSDKGVTLFESLSDRISSGASFEEVFDDMKRLRTLRPDLADALQEGTTSSRQLNPLDDISF